MKFKKFGKTLLMSALSTGVLLSVTSCVQSYSVGYLYVTGTVTSESNGNGIISGFKIDHNTGKLTSMNGFPVASGGANPVRAVLHTDGRFIYVLNRGVNAEGGSDCTTADPCKNSNITEFAVGASGILTAQETFYTQGVNPFRLITDGSNYIYVLDHDAPASNSTNSVPVAASTTTATNANCTAALGTSAPTCGDITAFKIDSTTGRLSLVVDSAVTSAQGSTLPYFPVPAYPVDFVLSGSYVLTLNATSTTASTSFPYTGGATVYPYSYTSTTGQLTTTGLASPGSVLNYKAGNAIVSAGSYVWVLNGTTTSDSKILAFTTGSNGSLVAPAQGAVTVDDPESLSQSGPIALVVEHSGIYFYVANQGNPNDTTLALSGIAGYELQKPFDPRELSSTPVGFGTGAGPVCMVEDPSDQYIYTANYDSATVTAQEIEQGSGFLNPLAKSTKEPSSYALTGKPSWCLVDGRTN